MVQISRKIRAHIPQQSPMSQISSFNRGSVEIGGVRRGIRVGMSAVTEGEIHVSWLSDGVYRFIGEYK